VHAKWYDKCCNLPKSCVSDKVLVSASCIHRETSLFSSGPQLAVSTAVVNIFISTPVTPRVCVCVWKMISSLPAEYHLPCGLLLIKLQAHTAAPLPMADALLPEINRIYTRRVEAFLWMQLAFHLQFLAVTCVCPLRN
jgi:hypothetical protein